MPVRNVQLPLELQNQLLQISVFVHLKIYAIAPRSLCKIAPFIGTVQSDFKGEMISCVTRPCRRILKANPDRIGPEHVFPLYKASLDRP